MDSLIGDFDNLKISALSKSKSLNKYINNVTIGPNCTILDETKSDPQNSQEIKKCNSSIIKPEKFTGSNNKRTSVGKILTEIEAQVKDEIETSVRSRLEKIQDASKQLDARLKSQWLKKQESLVAQSQQQEELMLQMLEEHDRKAYDHLQQLQLQYQKQAEERNKRNLELKKKEQQRHQLLILIESIQKQQTEFRFIYQEIVQILKEYNNPSIANDPKFAAISLKLKTLLETIEKIKEKCKSGTIANGDLDIAVAVVREGAKLKEAIQVLIAIRRQEEKLKNETINIPTPVSTIPQQVKTTPPSSSADLPDAPQVPPPPHPLPSSEPPQKPNKEVPSQQPVSILETFSNKNAFKVYSYLQQYLESNKNSFSQLITDPRLKQFRFHCQKAVNIPLNAISAVNSQHMLDKYHRLSNLLRGNNVEAGGTNVLPSQHPQGIAFCTDLLAKKFVLQGDLLISSNPESAHCYAAVLIALWHDFPEFGKLVLAYFYQTVPYLVPFYPPKISGQTDQDYYVSLGYNYIDGAVEKQDKFLKRMSGIMRLYAALTISKLKRGQQGPHPHGLSYAWMWIANVLNLEPRSDITATLLYDFLEVTGSAMLAAYGIQFQKMLNLINDVYLEKLRKIDSGGPVTRLEVLLQKIKKHGQIDPPKGRLSEGFW